MAFVFVLLMLMQQKRKLQRTLRIVSILSKYGFQDLAIRSGLSSSISDLNVGPEEAKLDLYERIRKAVEELGATFIKFGQAFSSREDLLPAGLIAELKKLQDEVTPEDLDIREAIESELNIVSEEYFSRIDARPIASASISQVYKAQLKDGSTVILKYKRPGIRETVETDLLIMRDLVKVLVQYSDTLRKVNLDQVLAAFTKSLHEELSFIKEQQNIIRFTQNFKEDAGLYPVHVYPEFSNDNLLCMSFVEGAKITDKETLLSWGLDLDEVVDAGLRLYLTQVIDHGFFHADPHPGNLLVMPNGQIAFIDLGSVGTMIPSDKEHLENFVLHFIQKDAKRLVNTIQKMALNATIENHLQLERDLHEIFNLLDSQSLEHIDVKDFFTRFSHILNTNEILMPDYVYLLVRGIVLIEGIGRELSPGMNIIEGVRPYVDKIIMARLQPEYMLKQALKEARYYKESLQVIPEELPSILKKINAGTLKLNYDRSYSPETRGLIQRSVKLISLGLFFLGSIVAASLFVIANQGAKIFGIPILAVFCLLISLICVMLFFYSLFQRKSK